MSGVDWDYYNKDEFSKISDKYLPSMGEGETLATQICAAVNKLVYKWYNDGDVFDNSYYLDGWANDLSSYANWLFTYVPEVQNILREIRNCKTEEDYEELLKKLTDYCFREEFMDNMSRITKRGSIYNCDGPFHFEADSDEDEDDDWEEEFYGWDIDDDEDDWEDE